MMKKNQWPDESLTKIATNLGLLVNVKKDPKFRGIMIQQYKKNLFNPVCPTIRNAVEHLMLVDQEDPQSVIVLHEKEVHGNGFSIYTVHFSK